jgi:hypothetical protein
VGDNLQYEGMCEETWTACTCPNCQIAHTTGKGDKDRLIRNVIMIDENQGGEAIYDADKLISMANR